MSEKYNVVVDKIRNELRKQKDFYDKYFYDEFVSRSEQMEENIKESLREGRLLKIGIVGEVKAGKSSFLNALIFNGEDVLPKASTPMTAALTKITYSKQPSAEIVFYSRKDWKHIEDIAKEYDKEFKKLYNEYSEKYTKNQKELKRSKSNYITETKKSPEEMKRSLEKKLPLKLVSCKELIVMAGKSSIDIYEYLGKNQSLNAKDIKGLQNYIGAEGKFTPIVKHVELKMDNEMLKDVEIVDTPGLNDPVISRGEKTKEFLSKCDVVFLLSYCGQFLAQEDIVFMCETLPREGIRNIVIVGSKFDSGILDDNKSKDIRTACNSSRIIYNRQAMVNIDKCFTSGYNIEVLGRLRDSLPPNYISSVLYSCAMKKKNHQKYTNVEENIIVRLKEQFRDFHDDYETLLSLSGINQIKRDKLFTTVQDKENIIAEKNHNILSDNRKILLEVLEGIHQQAIKNKNDLERYNKGELKEKLYKLQDKLKMTHNKIKSVFVSTKMDVEEFLNNLALIFEEEIGNYIDFDVEKHTDVEYKTRRGGFLWLKEIQYTEEKITYMASVPDVLANLRNYTTKCKKVLNNEFKNIVNHSKLESEIKAAIMEILDFGNDEFNEEDVLGPLRLVIKRIQIPKIDIEIDQIKNEIIDIFSDSVVEGNEIHKLKLQEERALVKISVMIRKKLEDCKKEIDEVLSGQASTFVDDIIKKVTDNTEKLELQIEDKENSIHQYEDFCDDIVQYKNWIMEMEI